jgi:hypothetical protein
MIGHLHALAALYRGKSPRYPLDRRLGGPESGLDDVEKRILDANGTRTTTPHVPTALSRLLKCICVVHNMRVGKSLKGI